MRTKPVRSHPAGLLAAAMIQLIASCGNPADLNGTAVPSSTTAGGKKATAGAPAKGLELTATASDSVTIQAGVASVDRLSGAACDLNHCKNKIFADLAEASYTSQQQFCDAAKAFSYDGACGRFSLSGSEGNIGSDGEVAASSDNCNIVVAFRGTQSSADFIADARFILVAPDGATNFDTEFSALGVDGRFHKGFYESTRFFANSTDGVWLNGGDQFAGLDMAAAIYKIKKSCTSEEGANITVTGHSLGGAIATLFAWHLQRKSVAAPALVTFGAPRVMNGPAAEQYGKSVGDRSIHYWGVADLIAQVPPTFLGYADNPGRFVAVNSSHTAAYVGYPSALKDLCDRIGPKACEDSVKPATNINNVVSTSSGAKCSVQLTPIKCKTSYLSFQVEAKAPVIFTGETNVSTPLFAGDPSVTTCVVKKGAESTRTLCGGYPLYVTANKDRYFSNGTLAYTCPKYYAWSGDMTLIFSSDFTCTMLDGLQ